MEIVLAAIVLCLRYEEESLYPALVKVFDDTYIESLLNDHDRVISGAKRLVELAGKEERSDEEVAEATDLIRKILPHVSDCDGLSIMVEVLPAGNISQIFESRSDALDEGLALFDWADQTRRRPVPVSG